MWDLIKFSLMIFGIPIFLLFTLPHWKGMLIIGSVIFVISFLYGLVLLHKDKEKIEAEVKEKVRKELEEYDRNKINRPLFKDCVKPEDKPEPFIKVSWKNNKTGETIDLFDIDIKFKNDK